MGIEVFNCEQGSAEWHTLHLGVPTASKFAAVMAKAKDEEAGRMTRDAYMLRLATERVTGEGCVGFSNDDTNRGNAMEPEAREFYKFLTGGAKLERVGFIRKSTHHGFIGASPDSLIGKNGALEIKTTFAHHLAKMTMAGIFPAKHKAQCQGVLLASERE